MSDLATTNPYSRLQDALSTEFTLQRVSMRGEREEGERARGGEGKRDLEPFASY